MESKMSFGFMPYDSLHQEFEFVDSIGRQICEKQKVREDKLLDLDARKFDTGDGLKDTRDQMLAPYKKEIAQIKRRRTLEAKVKRDASRKRRDEFVVEMQEITKKESHGPDDLIMLVDLCWVVENKNEGESVFGKLRLEAKSKLGLKKLSMDSFVKLLSIASLYKDQIEKKSQKVA